MKYRLGQRGAASKRLTTYGNIQKPITLLRLRVLLS